MTNKKIICPKCKSKEIIKWGKRNTENRGKIQRYCCKSCSETFVNDSFSRMRNSPEKITCALDLFYRGLSTREVQEHFKAFFPHNSDHSTILRWIRKFSLKIANFTDELKLQIGREVQIDEMEYKTLGKKSWFIDCIDTKTRFMVGSKYTKERNIQELREVIKKVRDKTNPYFLKVTTDGLQGYYEAIKRTFGYWDMKHGYIKHNVVNASKGDGFNIMIERLHNTIRQRTQNFRGFHGSIKSANAIMKGFEIYYNFIKKHESLGYKTPSELAIPNLIFKSENRWLELIKMSKL